MMLAGSLYIAYDDYVNELESVTSIIVSFSISFLLVIGLILRSNLARIITLIYLSAVVFMIMLLGSFGFFSALIVMSLPDWDVVIAILLVVTIFVAICWIFFYLLSKEAKDWFTNKSNTESEVS